MVAPIGLGRRKEVAFAVVATFIGLSLLEACARVVEAWVPPVPVDATLGFDAETRLFVQSGEDARLMTTNPNRLSNFRPRTFARRKPNTTFRVVALGESSVYLADPDLEVLRQHLRGAFGGDYRDVEVINAGGLSYGSHRLAILIRELVEYEPDLVLIYMGHNEFEEVEQLRLAQPSKRLMPLVRLAEHLALFRLTRDVALRFDRVRLEEAHRKRLLARSKPDFGRGAAYRFTMEDVSLRMDAFRNNLGSIVDTCRRKNVPVVIGTIPSNLVKPLLLDEDEQRYQLASDLFSAGRFDEGLVVAREVLRTTARRHQSSDLENGIIRSLSNELGLTLADVERAVSEQEPHGVPGYQLFLDHCHLNEDGNRVWRLTYERAIATKLLTTNPAASGLLARDADMEWQTLPPPSAKGAAVQP